MSDQKKEAKPKAKMTFSEWLDNYWYHYKIHTFLGALFLILLGIFIYDFVFAEKYDMTLSLAVKTYTFDEQRIEIEEYLKQFIDDYNGDGKKTIYVDMLNFPTDDPNHDAQMMVAMQTKFAGDLAVGERSLFFLDPEVAKSYEMEDVLLDLSERYPDCPYVDGIYLDVSPLFADMEFMPYLENYYLTQRDSEYMDGYRRKDSVREMYEYETQLMDRLVEELNKLGPPEEASETE